MGLRVFWRGKGIGLRLLVVNTMAIGTHDPEQVLIIFVNRYNHTKFYILVQPS